MTTFDFNDNQPEFRARVFDGDKSVKTERPYEIFGKTKKSKGTTFLDMECACGATDCVSRISFYYSGLNHYCNSRNLGSDTQININPSHKEENGRANNVMWDPTDENVSEFINFSETVREAIAFKQKLLNGLYAELQVRIKGIDYYGEVQLIVRKDETDMLFYLFEIPNVFPKVPLLNEAKTYLECLGLVATLPAEIDTSKIKNDYADMANPFFKPIIEWVKLLGEENQMELQIKNIWVIPE
ncbi:TPA: hypothetical protein DIC38_02945 [Candidatus Nomurabacteria bacterium]|nr:MAG: hypothetical protein O210_OD1C00001G0196 [Parcubacteria bacterium RAAC4_OD1_1]HCY26610.1 hypothetical protein [Candidatus Nomurabacteria bacterium]